MFDVLAKNLNIYCMCILLYEQWNQIARNFHRQTSDFKKLHLFYSLPGKSGLNLILAHIRFGPNRWFTLAKSVIKIPSVTHLVTCPGSTTKTHKLTFHILFQANWLEWISEMFFISPNMKVWSLLHTTMNKILWGKVQKHLLIYYAGSLKVVTFKHTEAERAGICP